LRFRKQDAIGHQLDKRVFATGVSETNLVTDFLTFPHPEFVGNAHRYRASCQAAWLGMTYQAVDTTTQLETKFRNLSGFARAGFACNYDNLIGSNGFFQLGNTS
jgi:hypothetical protein